jgi:hypothetical protein
MPVLEGHIGVLRNTLLTIDGVDYANQVTRELLTPDQPSQVTRTAVPDGAIVDNDSPTWTFGVAIVQKLAAGGLVKALNDAPAGTHMDVVWVPKKEDGEPQVTFTIVAKKVAVGSDVGQQPISEVAFDVVGEPDFSGTYDAP